MFYSLIPILLIVEHMPGFGTASERRLANQITLAPEWLFSLAQERIEKLATSGKTLSGRELLPYCTKIEKIDAKSEKIEELSSLQLQKQGFSTIQAQDGETYRLTLAHGAVFEAKDLDSFTLALPGSRKKSEGEVNDFVPREISFQNVECTYQPITSVFTSSDDGFTGTYPRTFGSPSKTMVKTDGTLTANPVVQQEIIMPGPFQNGASYNIMPIGTYKDLTIQQIKKNIQDGGHFDFVGTNGDITITFDSRPFKTGEAEFQDPNIVRGLFTWKTRDHVDLSEDRLLRLNDSPDGVEINLADYRSDIYTRAAKLKIFTFYFEGLPSASEDKNIPAIEQHMLKAISDAGLPSPDALFGVPWVLFVWTWPSAEKEPRDYHKYLIDYRIYEDKAGNLMTNTAIATGGAYSDKAIKNGALLSVGGVLEFQSAYFDGPKAIVHDMDLVQGERDQNGQYLIAPPLKAWNNEPGTIPKKFALEQNYPNPFNATTTINFDVPKGGSHVQIKLYDMLGREVATLADEQYMAGKHYVRLDANNLASGVYFYSMTANEFSEQKKLVLLK